MEGSGSRSWRSKTYGFGSGSGIKTEVITGSVLDPDPNLVRLKMVPRKGKMKNFHALDPDFCISLDLDPD
jgi:hypothetical protein